MKINDDGLKDWAIGTIRAIVTVFIAIIFGFGLAFIATTLNMAP